MEVAQQNGFNHYVETSAKTGQGIVDSFQVAAKHIYRDNKDRLDEFVTFSPNLRLTRTRETQ